MTLSTSTGAAILTPAQIEDSLIKPLADIATIFQVSTVVRTAGTTSLRVPTADSIASQFVAEGAEIPIDDIALSELVITPKKLAALAVITSELADGSTPAAADVIGANMAASLAKTLDVNAFGSPASPAPAGIAALSGVSAVTAHVDADGNLADLDFAAAAENAIALAGGNLTHFVASPAAALLLATAKTASAAATTLLTPDPTLPTRLQLLGRPVLVTPGVTGRVIWGLDKSRSFVALAEEAMVEADRSVFFTSDRIALRAKVRAAWGWPVPATVAKITIPTQP